MGIGPKAPASLMDADSPQAGITVNFLVVASLVSVIALTGLVCVVAAGILVVLR
jgi:hypothetical protein